MEIAVMIKFECTKDPEIKKSTLKWTLFFIYRKLTFKEYFYQEQNPNKNSKSY